MKTRTRTFITAGAIALALGLTGCATSDTARGTDAERAIVAEYGALAGEAGVIFDKGKAAADAQDIDALQDLGSDLMDIGMNGGDLADIPRVGPSANQAWDDAMDDFFNAGADMILGKFDRAAGSLSSGGDSLREAAAAVTAVAETL